MVTPAAQCLVGAVHRAVIHPRPPVGQVGGADHPGTVGLAVHAGGQPLFQRQHGAAPAHGGGHIGFLPLFQQVGEVHAGLLGGDNRLFDEKRPRPAAQQLQRVGMQAGGVGDKGKVIPGQGGGVPQVGELGVQLFCHTGAQRPGQVAAQCVGLQRQTPLPAQSMQVVQVPGPDGTQPHKQGGENGHSVVVLSIIAEKTGQYRSNARNRVPWKVSLPRSPSAICP